MNSQKNNNLISRSKRLAFLLRHDKAYPFEEHGWRETADLIANHGYTMEELMKIVSTNNKQRYEFSDDMTRVRARQGHSIQVDVELDEMVPPDLLYHGTGEQFLASIMEQGINRGNRLHVHLSDSCEAAINVGKRHGKPVVLVIDVRRMAEDNCHFYLSRNGVWLTSFVDVRYIKEVLYF